MYSDCHVHSYATRSSCTNDHIHCLKGTTGTPIPWGCSHIHYYNGVTSFNDGHVHCYNGCTGPSIPCPGGGHIHCMLGCTTIDKHHLHSYETLTGNKETPRVFRKKAV